MMKKDKWVWMPHPGHFIGSKDCKFHLNTYVGGYIVSTVGEYFPDSRVREIIALSRGIKINGSGDAWEKDYFNKIGFEDIGHDRKYETMVFKAERVKDICCPYRMMNPSNVDFESYNTSEDAYIGHLYMCKIWAKGGFK